MSDATQVILVNEMDEAIGVMDKLQAHRQPVLHRAFSVFIFNERGEMLLQQRSEHKYHSGGLWTNTCCSHPFPGEDTLIAAGRRLKEEMGFETTLVKIFDFIYTAQFDNGLSEYEFDHVFTGIYSKAVNPDRNEVKDYCYKSIDDIRKDLELCPHHYTAWFRIAFPKVAQWATDRFPSMNLPNQKNLFNMEWLIFAGIVIVTFLIMEGITWATHKIRDAWVFVVSA